MKKHLFSVAAIAALVALPACGITRPKWEADPAAGATKLEVQVDGAGRYKEIEYHMAPDEVPAAVRKAMDQLHPGGPYDDAEREMDGGKLYYELSRTVGGMEVEAMFSPEGVLHSEEIQVQVNKVPEVVRSAAAASLAGGQAAKWEEIRNDKREIVEYHVKMTRGGNKYKLLFSTDGKHLATYREVPAEIEVPIGGK